MSKYNLQAAEKNQKIQKKFKQKVVTGNRRHGNLTKEQFTTHSILSNQYLSIFLHLLQLLGQLRKKEIVNTLPKKAMEKPERKELRSKLESNKNKESFFLKTHYDLCYWEPHENLIQVQQNDLEFFEKINDFVEETLALHRVYEKKNYWSSKNTKKNYVISPIAKLKSPGFSSVLVYKEVPKISHIPEIFEKSTRSNQTTKKKQKNKKQKNSQHVIENNIVEPIKPRNGLINNQGRYCYLNSVLQCLFSIPNLQQDREGFLKNLFEKHNDSIEPISLDQYFDIDVEWNQEKKSQDSHSFLLKIFEKMEKEKDELIKNFEGKEETIIYCSNCRHQIITERIFLDLTLLVPKNRELSIKDCLQEKQNPYINIDHVCENCKKNTFTRMKHSITHYPDVFVLHLDRNSKEGRDIKMVEQFFMKTKHNKNRFDLFAVSHHHGTNIQGLFI